MFRLLIPIWQRLAFNNLVMGNYFKAEKYFRRIHRYAPSQAGFEYNIGLVNLAQSNYEKAESFFNKDITIYGESYDRTRVMGDLYYIWGKREQAGEWYRKALTDCDSTVDNNLLTMRIQKCNSKKAFENVQNSHILYNKGNEFLKGKKYKEAMEAFSAAVEQDNTNFQALNNKGSILMNNFKKYEDSLDCFKKALSMSSLPAISINIKKAREVLGEREHR